MTMGAKKSTRDATDAVCEIQQPEAIASCSLSDDQSRRKKELMDSRRASPTTSDSNEEKVELEHCRASSTAASEENQGQREESEGATPVAVLVDPLSKGPRNGENQWKRGVSSSTAGSEEGKQSQRGSSFTQRTRDMVQEVEAHTKWSRNVSSSSAGSEEKKLDANLAPKPNPLSITQRNQKSSALDCTRRDGDYGKFEDHANSSDGGAATDDGFDDGHANCVLSEGRGWQENAIQMWHTPCSQPGSSNFSSYDTNATVALATPYVPSLSARSMECYKDKEGLQSEEITEDWKGVTTVILKNLPIGITQSTFIEDLNANGFAGTFDYVYVPINRRTKLGRGYAFVNFFKPEISWRYKQCFDGIATVTKHGQFGKCLKMMPAAMQGFEANYSNYARGCQRRTHSPFTAQTRGGKQQGNGAKVLRERTQRAQRAEGNTSKPSHNEGDGGGPFVPALAKEADPPANTSTSTDDTTTNCDTAEATATSSVSSGRGACPYCAGETLPTFKFCRYCGSALTASDQQSN